jgi:sugar phosphate permease
LLSALGTIAMRKLPDVFSPNSINSLTLIGITVTAVVLLGQQIPLAYLAPIGLAFVSGFGAPNLSLYINKHAPNGIRTSALSVATSASGIGSGIGILISLKLIGHVSAAVFLSVAIIGCVMSLVTNIGLNTRELRSRKSPVHII